MPVMFQSNKRSMDGNMMEVFTAGLKPTAPRPALPCLMRSETFVYKTGFVSFYPTYTGGTRQTSTVGQYFQPAVTLVQQEVKN